MKSLELKPLIHVLNELETRSCLIEQQGNMIMNYYREPQIANELYKINSCTKSVISALVSIAMDQQRGPKPETPILEFFPQLATDSDSRKRDITIEHLLTMSAGFNWTEFGGQNSFPTMSKTSDWVQFVLSQPLSDVPGTRMEYSSGCSQLWPPYYVMFLDKQLLNLPSSNYSNRSVSKAIIGKPILRVLIRVDSDCISGRWTCSNSGGFI